MPSPDPGPQDAGLYQDAPCGLLLTRRDGTIERANATFCRWVGVEPGTLGGRRFQDLLTMGGRIFHQTHFGPLLQMQGSISEVKLDLVQPDGPPLPIMVNAERQSVDGEERHALAVFVAKERHAYERELMASRRRAEELATQQLVAQEQLRQADQRKDEFLAMLAHELRNPLAPIASSAQILRLAADDPARVRRVGEVIERQITHLTCLVNDLLDVSRVTRGLIELEFEPLDLARLVVAAVEQVRPLIEARHHRLQIDLPDGLVVRADRTRMVQIIANLLNNAAKYTPVHGELRVVARVADGWAQLEVIDNGIGIPADLLPQVFDLFSQAERTPDRSQGGLGIGLALVWRLAALHGAEVEAHSDGPGLGSRFVLRLPCAVPAATPPADLAKPGAGAGQALRVLVVDDNVDAALMLAEVIALEGHQALTAGTGRDALALLDAAAPPDVCVLDIGLPDMTGHELAARIRQALGPHRPVFVALTGYGQPHDRQRSRETGFDHHVVKPAEVDVLLDLLRGVQAQRRCVEVAACELEPGAV